jgi:hypothetical protein
MLALILPGFATASWQTLALLAAGVGATGLTLLLGTFLLGRRQPARPLKGPDPHPDPLTDNSAGKRQPAPPPTDPAPQPDPFIYGSARERRRAPRRGGRPVEVLISDERATAPPARGLVTDRSVDGLGLAVAQAVAPGTVLSLRPVQAPPGVAWVQVEVKSCRPEEETWELGCQFVTAPSYGVLLLFG